ncbi:MAG: hypothetical protein LBD54_01965, partial [Puniceicoccales bacterium]|nr:hypothetical protein [Puniceicoccales bacterium]
MKTFVRGSGRYLVLGGAFLGISVLSAWDFKWTKNSNTWSCKVDESQTFDTTNSREYRYYCDDADPLAVLRFKAIKPGTTWGVNRGDGVVMVGEEVFGDTDAPCYDSCFKKAPIFNGAFNRIGSWLCLPENVQKELVRLGVVGLRGVGDSSAEGGDSSAEGDDFLVGGDNFLAGKGFEVSVSVFGLPASRNFALTSCLYGERLSAERVVCEICGTKILNSSSNGVGGFVSFLGGGIDDYDEEALSRGLPNGYVIQKVGVRKPTEDGDGFRYKIEVGDGGQVSIKESGDEWSDALGPVDYCLPVRRGESDIFMEWDCFCTRFGLNSGERTGENPFDAGWLWRRGVMR